MVRGLMDDNILGKVKDELQSRYTPPSPSLSYAAACDQKRKKLVVVNIFILFWEVIPWRLNDRPKTFAFLIVSASSSILSNTCPEGCVIATLKETDIYKVHHLCPGGGGGLHFIIIVDGVFKFRTSR